MGKRQAEIRDSSLLEITTLTGVTFNFRVLIDFYIFAQIFPTKLNVCRY